MIQTNRGGGGMLAERSTLVNDLAEYLFIV